MKRSLWLLMLFLLAGHVPAASADSACEGRFVNPITDICWSCIFPLSLGSIKVSQGTVTYFQRDRYGRILGQVYAPDGMNVNQFMVRAGAAWVYEQYNTDPVLPVLQNEARQQKRGLWSDADPVPPWIWRHRK